MSANGNDWQQLDDATMRTIDDDDDDDDGDDTDDNASIRTRSYSNMEPLLRHNALEGAIGNNNVRGVGDGENEDNGMNDDDDDDEEEEEDDEDDDNDDEDTNYWTMAYEQDDENFIDPFDVDVCKILHCPGAMNCRGRNIVHILDDRSLFGPRFRRNSCGATHPDDNSNPGAGDNESIQGDDNIAEAHGLISTPPTSPVAMGNLVHQQEHPQAPPSDCNSNNNNNNDFDVPQTPPRAMNFFSTYANLISTRNETPPADTQASGFGQYSIVPLPQQLQQQQQQQQHKSAIHNNDVDIDQSNHINTTTSVNNTSKTIHRDKLDVKHVTSEIVAYAEYASATKFKASYLNHLSDGIDVPQRSGGGRSGAHHDEGGEFRRRDASLGNHDEDESQVNAIRYTQEHLETNRLLQEHLRMYHHPRQQPQLQRQQQQLLQQLHPSSDGGTAVARGRGAPPPPAGGDDNGTNGTTESDRRYIGQQIEATRRMHQLQRQAIRSTLHPLSRHGHHPPLNHPTNNNNGPTNNNYGNDAPATATRAVSTISIAFSPDSRTVASTHGDHTVKISCCHTGKLIRSLEGHPRTPWTVKFHPTNSRIVASGCLGFQVRVWDWNYQKESVRKQRMMDGERKWKGRYAFAARRSSNWDGDGVGDDWGDVNTRLLSRGFVGVDSLNNHFGPTSPRGVVEQHPWRSMANATSMSAEGVEGKQIMWGYANSSNCPAPTENDDFASCTLLGAGIPLDDPAWYDTESEMYNYDTGIGVCLNMIRLHSAIISLSFHPSGEVLAVASGNTLHVWDYNEEKRKLERKSNAASATDFGYSPRVTSERESEGRILDRSNNNDFPRTQTIDFPHASALRCVHFPPCGTVIIVGGVNPPSSDEGLPNSREPRRGGMSGGGMSFHLRLWDFSLDAVLDPVSTSAVDEGSGNNGQGRALPRGGRVTDEGELILSSGGLKEVLRNPRTIIPRVLLYNDGGFDVSKDGKILSACAEFWLPEGIESVMELLDSEQQLEESQQQSREDSYKANEPPSSPLLENQRCYSSPPRQEQAMFPDPRTPPANYSYPLLEPPSPPGKRNVPNIPRALPVHNPHPLSVVAACHPAHREGGGRYVPHIAAVSLDTALPPNGEPLPLHPKIVRTESMRRHPNLGKLLQAAPLDGAKSGGVTCVKLSPSAEYCLLGYGVRENIQSVYEHQELRHPVTSLYNVNQGMQHVCTLTCANDDVNIARFHPDSGHGFVYGTKQGRVRVLAKRPWNYYHLDE